MDSSIDLGNYKSNDVSGRLNLNLLNSKNDVPNKLTKARSNTNLDLKSFMR